MINYSIKYRNNLSFTSWTEKETVNTYKKTSWFKDKKIIIKTAIASFPDNPLNVQFDEMLNRLSNREFINRFEQTSIFSDMHTLLKNLQKHNEPKMNININAGSIIVKYEYEKNDDEGHYHKQKEFSFASYDYKEVTHLQQASICVAIKELFSKERYNLTWGPGPSLIISKITKNDVALKEW